MKAKLFILLILIISYSCKELNAEQFTDLKNGIEGYLKDHKEQVKTSGQIIIVTSREQNPEYAELYSIEFNNGTWEEKYKKITATIGKAGFAGTGMKKEGDGKTPSGIFKIGTAFGYEEKINTRMPYRQSTENDFWIDDVNSERYNTWVTGEPEAKSFERMKRNDHLYKWGIVVEYNTNPVIKGKGSAIFLHVWRAPGKKTAGCIAMSENDILKLLKWHDPAKSPIIIMEKQK